MSNRASAMRQEIMLCVKANNVPNDGDIFLSLAYLSELELVKICQELHIAVPVESDDSAGTGAVSS